MTEKMKNRIKSLAKKTADYWNGLAEYQKENYMDNGTHTVFEDVDLLSYMAIVDADDDYSLMDMLEEEFWSQVKEIVS